jgi:hypothetical protein
MLQSYGGCDRPNVIWVTLGPARAGNPSVLDEGSPPVFRRPGEGIAPAPMRGQKIGQMRF